MDEPRLKTEILVKSWLRRCGVEGIFATIARKGDPDAGVVFVKVNLLGAGFRVLGRERNLDGDLIWGVRAGEEPVVETEADDYLARQAKYDPDLWVIEVEDRDGRVPFVDEG